LEGRGAGRQDLVVAALLLALALGHARLVVEAQGLDGPPARDVASVAGLEDLA
jgi:hypothetical protein